FLRDLPHGAEAEDLEAAGIGQDRALPAHEAVQATVLRDHVRARAQPKMKSIAQHDLRIEGLERRGRHCLDRSVRAYGHEYGRLDNTVRQLESSAPRRAVAVRDAEFQGARSISIASP